MFSELKLENFEERFPFFRILLGWALTPLGFTSQCQLKQTPANPILIPEENGPSKGTETWLKEAELESSFTRSEPALSQQSSARYLIFPRLASVQTANCLWLQARTGAFPSGPFLTTSLEISREFWPKCRSTQSSGRPTQSSSKTRS